MLYKKLDKSYLVYVIKSHRFLIVNSKIFKFLKIYFSSNGYNDFSFRTREKRSKKIYNDILKLVSANNDIANKKTKKSPLNSNNYITKFYKIKSKLIKINYQNKRLLSIVHPKFKHLETRISKISASNYYVSLNRNKVLLHHNKVFIGSWKKTKLHEFLGKVSFKILCSIYGKGDDEWMGTFHACAVSRGSKSILIIGDSGSGKSTLTALLLSKGYKLVSDDFVPVLSKDKKIYHFPSGVSIKEGSLNVLSKYFTGLKNEKKYRNPVKNVKINYLNPNKYVDKKRFSYTCSKVLLVNYKGKSNTKMKAIKQDVALEKLISQSWISDKIQNVKSFLSWVEKLKFYELTYSDNKKALEKVSEII